MIQIVGVAGLKGSGKSTLADYLVKNHNFVELSFASVLKEILTSLFVLDMDLFVDADKKEQRIETLSSNNDDDDVNSERVKLFITPRILMQRFGTDILRDQLEKVFPEMEMKVTSDQTVKSVFVYCLLKKLQKMLSEEKKRQRNGADGLKIVISDIRFEDELRAIEQFILAAAKDDDNGAETIKFCLLNVVLEKYFLLSSDDGGVLPRFQDHESEKFASQEIARLRQSIQNNDDGPKRFKCNSDVFFIDDEKNKCFVVNDKSGGLEKFYQTITTTVTKLFFVTSSS